jgi:hypothetical protein
MTDLETLIAELEADDPGATFVRSDTVLSIARELLTARKVVEAAMRWRKGYGTKLAAADLADALSAHDAAEVARNEGDRT